MAIEYRYVGRRDNPSVVTGQAGYCDFAGQYDTAVYQEFFVPFPASPIFEPQETLRAAEITKKLTQYFASLYATLRPITSADERAQLIQLSVVINAAVPHNDLAVIRHVVETAAISPTLDPYRQEMLDIIDGH